MLSEARKLVTGWEFSAPCPRVDIYCDDGSIKTVDTDGPLAENVKFYPRAFHYKFGRKVLIYFSMSRPLTAANVLGNVVSLAHMFGKDCEFETVGVNVSDRVCVRTVTDTVPTVSMLSKDQALGVMRYADSIHMTVTDWHIDADPIVVTVRVRNVFTVSEPLLAQQENDNNVSYTISVGSASCRLRSLY